MTPKCLQHNVVYSFFSSTPTRPNSDVYRVQFKTNLHIKNTEKTYAINYFPGDKKLSVVEHIPVPFTGDYAATSYVSQIVFEITYTSFSLTPENVNEKLPILLLFL